MKENYNAKDCERGRRAEQLVLDLLSTKTDEYNFYDVANDPECRIYGDILALGEEDAYYIEVKNDSKIGTTRNVLCEEEVFNKYTDRYELGNMACDGDIYCVVAEDTREIFFIDFKVMKEIYKRYGEYNIFDHYNQTTFCYLLPLTRIKQHGGLIKTLSY